MALYNVQFIIAAKKGTSPATENFYLLTRLTAVVLQVVAVWINRRRVGADHSDLFSHLERPWAAPRARSYTVHVVSVMAKTTEQKGGIPPRTLGMCSVLRVAFDVVEVSLVTTGSKLMLKCATLKFAPAVLAGAAATLTDGPKRLSCSLLQLAELTF